jgi:acyl-CoA thioesterase FadM
MDEAFEGARSRRSLRSTWTRGTVMLFRLLAVLAASLSKARAGFFDACAVTLRVWPNDLDANLHMNNSRYLLAMDLGRWDLVARTGLWRELWRRRWFPVVASATLRFRRSLDPWQRYTLVTRLVAWDEKWCYLEQRFERDGTVHAVGRVKALFRGREGNVPTAALLAAAGRADAPLRRLPEAIRVWREAEAAEARAADARKPGTETARAPE